jgi:hypothetical protein
MSGNRTKKNMGNNRSSRNSNLSRKINTFRREQYNFARREANKNSNIFEKERRYTQHNNSRYPNINRYPNNVIGRFHNNLPGKFANIPQELPFDNIDTIIGPYTMRMCKIKVGDVIKNFIIFGEQHELNFGLLGDRQFNPSSTVAFDGFIKALLKKYNNINFDLYTEQGYFEKNKNNNNATIEKYKTTQEIGSILKLIEYTFADCLRLYDKSKCEYNNLRIHLADLRTYLLDKDLIFSFYHEYLPLNTAPEDILNAVNSELNIIISKFSEPSSKMQKQRKGIPDNILEIIDSYFKYKYNNQELSVNNVISKITAIMDNYTILRMLRPLDEIKNTFGRGTKNWKQQNIIGYFGDKHSKNIFTLLRYIADRTNSGFVLPTLINKTKLNFNSYIKLGNDKQNLSGFIEHGHVDDIADIVQRFMDNPIPLENFQ